MPAPRKIVRSRTGDLFTRKKLTRSKSLRERGEARPNDSRPAADTATPAAATEPKIYKSQLMVKFSKPSFSIYLDYVPRDKCFKVAYIVEDCSYTCHQRCRDLVTLDCPSDTASDLDLSEVTDPNQDVDLVEVQTLVRCDNVAVAEVRETDSTIKAEMIEKYNATSHGLYMTLVRNSESAMADPETEDRQARRASERRRKAERDRERRLSIVSVNEDGTEDLVVLNIEWSEDGRSFHGFIRVHMNLFRPINIVAGTRPPSIYDVLQPEQTLERTLASFYLPRDTVKALHIDNDTTVHEVISSLLKKFKIVDDPRKFALYERLTEQGESTKVKMRRLADSERPLELALSWSHHGVVNKKFVLQENDTGDILWDNFTLPELNNFLTMLNKEEEDYKRRVRQKYTEMKRRIAEQMDQLRPGGAHSEPAPAAATAE
ncbi:Ras association domain-containing protein 1 [Amphibalanus amphitrite]|uniref:Ras association domain-containing protein 1 n=1 Tax=Amphibalanus amphitrite TaxID=1232801 RepID=A0A6A4X7M4_AMPAM|nr:Ras association domain-containing protein 1 [Amphibalanus amphitrite]KAF0310402.1 Ras association domain-containing protein 1 [Amphibalanus amphitrite]